MHSIAAKFSSCTKKHMKLSMCIWTLASSAGFDCPTVSRNISLYRASLGQDTLELWTFLNRSSLWRHLRPLMYGFIGGFVTVR